jgi:hypothetical protein
MKKKQGIFIIGIIFLLAIGLGFSDGLTNIHPDKLDPEKLEKTLKVDDELPVNFYDKNGKKIHQTTQGELRKNPKKVMEKLKEKGFKHNPQPKEDEEQPPITTEN